MDFLRFFGTLITILYAFAPHLSAQITTTDRSIIRQSLTLRGVKVDSIATDSALVYVSAAELVTSDAVKKHVSGRAATLSISRNPANNILVQGIYSISVENAIEVEQFAPTSGSTVTVAGTLPIDRDNIVVLRNGIRQYVGRGLTSLNLATKVITFTRAFTSGETVEVEYTKQ